ncbi:hypothetical protein E2C01_090808 [Portunus trituberculatus]|uniref:Uncharacterized protein n=1 Tax=Portunus trituberculatus TaxID=210409 RepID=A0A5B7JFR0_PORTR|nr:hypothetical protein [Portunus trituberculatus]
MDRMCIMTPSLNPQLQSGVMIAQSIISEDGESECCEASGFHYTPPLLSDMGRVHRVRKFASL